MFRKNILSIVLVILVIFNLFIGCSNKKSDNKIISTIKNENEGNLDSSIDDFQTNLEKLYSRTQERKETVYIQDYIDLFNQHNNGKYIGDDFSDGVAWIHFYLKSSFCIDKTGRVLFMVKDSLPLTNFNNGIAIMDNGTIIDKTGQVISSKNEGVYDDFIIQKDKELNERIYDGVVWVRKEVESYKGTNVFIGAIDSKGDWILEPTDEFTKAEYIDDGIYYVGTKKNAQNNEEKLYFDVKNKKVINEEEFKKIRANKFIFNTDGFYKNINDENIFSEKNGDKIIDLSKYLTEENNTKIEASDFIDGYSILEIENQSNNAVWYTIMDKNGKEMFELRKLDNWEKIYGFSCGLVKIEKNDKVYFIDVNGNIVIDNLPEMVGLFSEDALFVKERNCYIDKTGKKLF